MMKKLLAIVLILILGLVPIYGADAVAVPTAKDEVVYGLLDLAGTVQDLYVVNSFNSGTITDYGNYSNLSNMSTAEELMQESDTISIETTADKFYYQGTLENKNLPWDIKINYQLDKQAITAAELAGKSGELQITITTTSNPAINSAFFDNYLLQVTLMLDTDKATEIASANATLANAGKNKVITHTVMPGQNADILITANIKNFSMSGFELTALPLSMFIEMPETSSLTAGTKQLSDAVESVNTGVKELSAGLSKSYAGAQRIKGGSADLAKGLTQLNKSGAELIGGSTKIKAGLQQFAEALAGDTESPNLGNLAELPINLKQLAAGLNEITSGMQKLQGGYSESYLALSQAISAIPETNVDPSALYGAVTGNAELQKTLDQLAAYYGAGKKVKATFEATQGAFGQIEKSLESMSTNIGTISAGLLAMSSGIEQALSGSDLAAQTEALKAGLTQLSNEYKQFHSGLGAYVGGVKSLASGYGEVNSGISSLTGGLGQLNTGARELANGTGQLSTAAKELPATISAEIAKLADQYNKADFQPVSFVSDKNTNVNAVQFVLKTASITAPEKVELASTAVEKLNFWQKLLKLFGL